MKYGKKNLPNHIAKEDLVAFFREREENGAFSNWWKCFFSFNTKLFGVVKFNSSEQLFMYLKAELFNDIDTAKKIISEKDMARIKALGREVKNFSQEIWDKKKYEIMLESLKAKFGENKEAQKLLLSTGNKILVEASPYDGVWGIKLPQTSEDIFYPLKWKGENLLGFALMECRDIFLSKQ